MLTCPFGHHQFGFAPGSIPLGGVRCHRDGVSGVWLESSNDHFLWATGEEAENRTMSKCDFIIFFFKLKLPYADVESDESEVFPVPLY